MQSHATSISLYQFNEYWGLDCSCTTQCLTTGNYINLTLELYLMVKQTNLAQLKKSNEYIQLSSISPQCEGQCCRIISPKVCYPQSVRMRLPRTPLSFWILYEKDKIRKPNHSIIFYYHLSYRCVGKLSSQSFINTIENISVYLLYFYIVRPQNNYVKFILTYDSMVTPNFPTSIIILIYSIITFVHMYKISLTNKT